MDLEGVRVKGANKWLTLMQNTSLERHPTIVYREEKEVKPD